MEGDQGVEVVVNPTPANDETPAVVDQTDVKVEEPKAKEEAETVPSMGDQGVEEDASSTPANDEAPAVVCQAEDIKGEEPKAEAKEEGDAPKSVPSNDENNVEATEEAVAPSKEVEENKEQTEANEDSKEENKDEKAKSPSPRKDAKRSRSRSRSPRKSRSSPSRKRSRSRDRSSPRRRSRSRHRSRSRDRRRSSRSPRRHSSRDRYSRSYRSSSSSYRSSSRRSSHYSRSSYYGGRRRSRSRDRRSSRYSRSRSRSRDRRSSRRDEHRYERRRQSPEGEKKEDEKEPIELPAAAQLQPSSNIALPSPPVNEMAALQAAKNLSLVGGGPSAPTPVDHKPDLTLVANATVEVMHFSDQQTGAIIGRGGDLIRKIATFAMVKTKVSEKSPSESYRNVTISGSKDNVERAKWLITQAANTQLDIGLLSGSLLDIPMISVTNAPPPPSAIAPSGALQTAVMNTAAGGPLAEEVVRLNVPDNKCGALIGPGGNTVNGIMARTGARINVQLKEEVPIGVTFREVTVAGSKLQVAHAMEAIAVKMQEGGLGASGTFA